MEAIELVKLIGAAFAGFSLSSIWYLLTMKKKVKAAKEETYTKDAQELLSDLFAHGAIVKIHRINPNDILLRSPKQSEVN